MKNPIRVFLCSTYTDLVEERRQVLESVRRLKFQQGAMEFFVARTNKPIETCLDEVRRSDVLIVIVGHCYGSLVPNRGISFSEAEYREGLQLGKPCLVCLRGDDVPVLPRFVERDAEKAQLLDQWKSELLANHTVSRFSSLEDLVLKVTQALQRTVMALLEKRLQEGRFVEELHHVSLPVRNLETSLEFYRDILKLDEIQNRPKFPFPGVWFALPGGGQHLHLVENPNGTFRKRKEIDPRDCHLALRVTKWREVFEFFLLKNLKILVDPYPLGFLQLYLLDPDNHVIEINAAGLPDFEAEYGAPANPGPAADA